MTALTEAAPFTLRENAVIERHVLSGTVYKGGFAEWSPTQAGTLIALAGTNEKFAGLFMESGVSGETVPVAVEGTLEMPVATLAADGEGSTVYCATDNPADGTLSASSATAIGTVSWIVNTSGPTGAVFFQGIGRRSV